MMIQNQSIHRTSSLQTCNGNILYFLQLKLLLYNKKNQIEFLLGLFKHNFNKMYMPLLIPNPLNRIVTTLLPYLQKNNRKAGLGVNGKS